MAPLTAAERQTILQQPGATAELLDEFERRISDFFMFDPDMITAETELTNHARIKVLHSILFPGKELILSPVAAKQTTS